ncbi:hypothetical protein SAMN05444581_102221 [Methylocapsa palsarum]|uniref:Uncharacterized protein n=1 Tax=Methylocapsa palsarum TaxID=1612308 RepID=A0A1I3WZ67_9HYPH|nr:hypothetical protein SAMN05444581_102221 [Methylocapsa palsarum]
MFERIKIFLEKHVIQDVPPELEFCEFGCSRRNCEQGNWTRCPNRLRVDDHEEAMRWAAQNMQTCCAESSEIRHQTA